jgi:hypothetical protein
MAESAARVTGGAAVWAAAKPAASNSAAVIHAEFHWALPKARLAR